MASQTVKTLQIPDDIEFRVLSNAFGLLIAMSGLLGGNMLHQRGFEYWLDDIIPLMLMLYMAFRLYRNFISTITLYQDVKHPTPATKQKAATIEADPQELAQLPGKAYTTEEIVDEVAKRIGSQQTSANRNMK